MSDTEIIKKEADNQESDTPIDLDAQRSSTIHFMQEQMKERPENKRKLLRRTLITISLAAIFGIVSCFTFFLLEPVISKMLNPEEELEIVVLPTEEEELSPEDMAVDDSELSISQEENIQISGYKPENQENIVPGNSPDLGQETDQQGMLPLESYQKQYEELAVLTKEMEKSMVTVTRVSSDINWIEDTLRTEGNTSGVLVADNGKELLILANYEGLPEADDILVTFCDGSSKSAVLKQYDKLTGLGILAVPLMNIADSTMRVIQYATLGSSLATALTGKPVIAIGSPIGISRSVCYGMITSEGTPLGIADSNYKIVTTDIYGSKKGSGILVNLQGNVVGVIYNEYSTESMGNQVCAIGISELKRTIEKMSNGEQLAYLGLHGVEISNEMRNRYNIPYGAYISSIEIGSPAMNAGIQSGDIVTRVNNTEIVTYGELVGYINKTKVDQVLNITIERQGQSQYQEMKMELKVGEQP